MGLFTIGCKKATYLASKKEANRLSFIGSMQLRAHLSICSLCRLFEQQTKLLGSHAQHAHRDAFLPEEKKEELKQQLQSAINHS